MLNRLEVVKGCPALNIHKGDILKVEKQPRPVGPAYAIVVSWMHNGPHERTLYARHYSETFNMSNGDPTKKIRVKIVE